MSDFFLDLRQPRQPRCLTRAAEQLRFADNAFTLVTEQPTFGLAVIQTGDPALWAPFCDRASSLVAVAGRPVFDESQWDAGETVFGEGGLAAKVIYQQYCELGVEALSQINGNFAVVVHDKVQQCLHLVTDCCGAYPVFEVHTTAGPVYCSHPDVLARLTGEKHRIDESSLAEFILSGTVTPPFTYYANIRAADYGTVFTIPLSVSTPARVAKRRYFHIGWRGDPAESEEELAVQLADALRRAVQRRTNPRLGRIGVALSGGLDSRVVLASCLNKPQTLAFCCYDHTNRELKVAEAIAKSLSVTFMPIRRDPEYYADNAERGVLLSGGMGSFANNHFLGILPALRTEGVHSLLTGCYCDYLFKALPLNRNTHWLTRREALAPFRHEFYFDHFSSSTALAGCARARWESRIPAELRTQQNDQAMFEIEARRTFPLSYEGDNQQRLVPQRVTGWSPPLVDRDVIEIYCRLPFQFKLNNSLFRKVVLRLTPELQAIPDANTGAVVGAGPVSEWVHDTWQRLERRLVRLWRPDTSNESWPDWAHYGRHSQKLRELWNRPNADAKDLFVRVLGPSGVPDEPAAVKPTQMFLFIGLLTVKLWMDQRA